MPTAWSRGLRYRRRHRTTRFVGALAVAACVACLALVTACASQGASGVPVGAGSAEASGSAVQPSGTPGSMVLVKDDANGTMVHVRVGTDVELLLSSSYWTVDGSSAVTVLRQDGASTVLPRPTGCPAVPGLGCQPVRTDFTATAVGTAIITANRTVCGEAMRCPPDKQHFLVTIVVSG